MFTCKKKQIIYIHIFLNIGAEALKDLLSAELDKVLVSLHEKLHDETHFKELCSSDSIKLEFPQRTSSHIYVKGVTFTLEYLQVRVILNYLKLNISMNSKNEIIFLYMCL